MTTRERIGRMYEHREADQVPISDTPWPETVARWRREGLPEGVHYADFFGIDRTHLVPVDISPRYDEKILEETGDYVIRTTAWGGTERTWKHAASVPEHLAFTVTDPESWARAKERMTPSLDRIPWQWLEAEYPRFRQQGDWFQARFRFGFEAVHAFTVGTERTLMAMCTDPEWIVDMFNHYLDMNIVLFDAIWEKGYRFDAMSWTDDLGYKLNQFFSLDMYRQLLKPVQKRAAEWGHAKGIRVKYHSCGDIRPFLPELIEIGIDGLHPLEVKAGMDPARIKQEYGSRLVLHGGMDALLWQDVEAMEANVRKLLPVMKENGGYIFSTDHTVPSSVSLQDFHRIVAIAREVGRYE